jgi:hypothetical protein
MILDLSEEGMAMQTMSPLEEHSRVPMHLSLGEPAIYLETTGYVAWADALGRAGVRFSDLPEESRARLREWLTSHDSTPSWKAPRWVVREQPTYRGASQNKNGNGVALSLETEPRNDHTGNGSSSTSVQYEFKSLGGDLDAALTLIVGRACSITRGTGAAVALSNETGMVCRAVAGATVLPIGTLLDVTRGFSGECIRLGKPLRCDDAELDSRVDARACRELDIRSILAAPVLYERNIVGLLEVFSTQPGAFDDGDVAVVERLSQTVVLTLSRADAMQRH